MIFQEPMTSLNPVFTIGFQILEPSGCTRGWAAMRPWQGRTDAALVGVPRIPPAGSKNIPISYQEE